MKNLPKDGCPAEAWPFVIKHGDNYEEKID